MTSATESESLFTVQLSVIGADGEGDRYAWEANSDQRAALATRFGCVEIPSMEVKATITPLRKDGYFRVRGEVSACVVQNCVISLAPVTTDFEKKFELILFPEIADEAPEPEFEEKEFETYIGNTVDLGEIGVIELALALDPYPRAPGVSVTDLGPGGGDKGYGVNEEGHIGRNRPFEALAALKRKG
jgi:hypothetical protein